MCFSEFIGYTCGHSSPEVLRPCPMTTQFYTNPVCTSHARRPILAPEMCPACQRLIHGRAVLISEWEHRWMHERGVCGCEVRFPDLVRPRVVSRSRPGQTIGRFGQMRDNTLGSTNGAAPTKAERINAAGSKVVPAHYQERTTKAGPHNLEVAVRIPSLYGAEWVDEHRQLHRTGACKCAGHFAFYECPEPIKTVPSSSALLDNGPGQAVQTKITRHSSQTQLGDADFQSCATSEYLNPKGLSSQDPYQHKVLPSYSHPLPPHLPHQQGDTMTQQSSSTKVAGVENTLSTASGLRGANNTTTSKDSSKAATKTSSKPPPLVVSSYYPQNPQPQRSPGAIYEVDPTRSTNRLYNHACNGGATMTTVADFQSVEFPRAEGYLPLVGLPIGAGPEGAPGLSHVGQFEDCVLHTKKLIACLGDEPAAACLLASRSKSFACLHDATGPREDEVGFDWRQEALPVQERTRSADPSEHGDSNENDQLFLS